jgi:hypothetical protein
MLEITVDAVVDAARRLLSESSIDRSGKGTASAVP